MPPAPLRAPIDAGTGTPAASVAAAAGIEFAGPAARATCGDVLVVSATGATMVIVGLVSDRAGVGVVNPTVASVVI
jgi:hypothetical protein